tara:strand:+ start:237 stop:467 length:231 start_codon:yes stop_codon:yes gene_type:complete
MYVRTSQSPHKEFLIISFLSQQTSDFYTLLFNPAPDITGEPLEPSAELLEKNFHVWPFGGETVITQRERTLAVEEC